MDINNIRLHVFEPKESSNKESWYKNTSTFNNCKCFDNISLLHVGDIIEDDMGTRFRILSRHWKWEKTDLTQYKPIFELTLERYIRRGKQNPFML